MKTIIFQALQVRSALVELLESCDEVMTTSDTESLVIVFDDFEFLLWHSYLA